MRLTYLTSPLISIVFASILAPALLPVITPKEYVFTSKNPVGVVDTRIVVQIAAPANGAQNVTVVSGTIRGNTIQTVTLDNGAAAPCVIRQDKNSLDSCNFLVTTTLPLPPGVFGPPAPGPTYKITFSAGKTQLENVIKGEFVGFFMQVGGTAFGVLVD